MFNQESRAHNSILKIRRVSNLTYQLISSHLSADSKTKVRVNLLYWSYTKGNPSQVIFTHGTRVFRRWCSHVKWMFLKLCLCFIPFRFKAKETLNAERMFSNLISCWKTFNILTTSHHLNPIQTHLSGLFLLFLVTDFLSFFF